ncbi:exopolysaccharide biosynthesis polyprenyl glycosylphosphotransferase [Pseudozobellia thermophila]|uniref:Putative colanic acid biosysnthesis UDP-glucose lipid carrier transferase n=1 Tax=Pseudozobellia thermophila TaxID=192903 RepID=A0A1M6KNN6_9FLAO|nr:exopolysaccharide biosynthesis polyprenyl glycosylphosphotransferase [Pseudozobellia thermophila]SHJ60547.1 putative colanic acid biosysnthesis UDP-glucose lipid carrier transferase [Pseudozobellia thermophila]
MNFKNRYILINLLAFEFVLLNLVLLIYLYLTHTDFSIFDLFFLKKVAALAVIYNLSWLFIILYIRGEEFYFTVNKIYLKSLVTSTFFFVGFVTVLIVVLKINFFRPSAFIVPIFIFSYLNLISHKYLLRFLRKRASHLFSNTLLIGSGHERTDIKSFVNAMTQYGYNIVGYLEEGEENPANTMGLAVTGSVRELRNVLASHSIDEIFIDTCDFEREAILDAIKIADSFGTRVKLIPENPYLLAKNYKAVTIGDLAIFKLRQSPLDNFSKTILKRLFDFCFALVVLVLLSPLFLLLALLIVIDSKGPVFYTPYRKGEAGKTFKCYKFRTMSVCEDPLNGTKSTVVNDPRITRVGKILRKADLDELPQFFNVLKGEMSVIGPRPHRITLQDDLRKSVNDYMVRSYVKPGISGWAQVNGWRGPTQTKEQKTERIKHDLWYIENWSFWLDIKIIFMTVFGNHHKKAF